MVTVYTTDNCPYCQATKDYLSFKNVKYEEINFSSNEDVFKEVFSITGATVAPQVFFNKKDFVVGYDVSKLEEFTTQQINEDENLATNILSDINTPINLVEKRGKN